MQAFVSELRRRNVLRVAAFYAAAGWLLVQVATQVLPFFEIPNGVVRLVVVAIIAGFPFALVFSWFYELTPQGLKLESEVARDQSITRHTGQKLNRAIIAVLSLAVLVLLARLFWPHRQATDQAASGDDKSIAVLPFANLSNDPNNAFFADGMQDEILTKLAKIGALRVVSRTSTEQYGAKPGNLSEIAHQLGVANVLEGSVQKAGNAVHINVQLIRAAGDEHLWAETYDRTLDNVFTVEGEVASAIAEQLDAKLSGAERQDVAALPTSDPEAYQDFLRARTRDSAAYSLTVMQDALDLLGDAVRRDPKFTRAWAEIAYEMSALYFDGIDPQRSTAAAIRQAAQAAMQLEPQSVEALMAHGYALYRVERDYKGALEDFRLALAKQPNNVDLLRAIFLVERRTGQWDESVAHMQEAMRLEPRNVSVISPIGCEGLNYLRRFDEAAAALQLALQATREEPNVLSCLGLIEQSRGRLDAAETFLSRTRFDPDDLSGQPYVLQRFYRRDYAAAIRLLEAIPPRDDAQLSGIDVQNLIYLGYARKWNGDADGARVAFERVIRVLQASPDTMEHVEIAGHNLLALAYAGLGRKAEAVEAARRGVELNGSDAIKLPLTQIAQAQVYAQAGQADAAIAMLPHLLEVPAGLTPALLAYDPMWDPIRNDPRFQKLVAAVPAAVPGKP